MRLSFLLALAACGSPAPEEGAPSSTEDVFLTESLVDVADPDGTDSNDTGRVSLVDVTFSGLRVPSDLGGLNACVVGATRATPRDGSLTGTIHPGTPGEVRCLGVVGEYGDDEPRQVVAIDPETGDYDAVVDLWGGHIVQHDVKGATRRGDHLYITSRYNRLYEVDLLMGQVVASSYDSTMDAPAWHPDWGWFREKGLRSGYYTDPEASDWYMQFSEGHFETASFSDKGRLWLAESSPDHLTELDPCTGNVLQDLPLLDFHKRIIGHHQLGDRIYVLDDGSGAPNPRIHTFDAATGERLARVDVPDLNWGLTCYVAEGTP